MTQEPTAGVMTREQFHKRVPRIAMDSIGIVPTSKYVPEPAIVRNIIKMIDQKRMIVIFPEGGRRWDGRPKPFIESTLKLFWKMKIPVHPVQLHGSYLGWPRWADWPRKSRVELHFLKPLHASGFQDYDAFARACRDAVHFEEYDAPEQTWPYKSWRPAAGIGRFLYRCPITGESGAVFTPDGSSVRSHKCGLEFKLDDASRLVDKHGEKHSIIGFYDQINEMPMAMTDDENILKAVGRPFFRLNARRKLIPLGKGSIRLNHEQIHYRIGTVSKKIPLENLRAISIELNHKLVFITEKDTIQVDLEGHSPLQWQLYIRRLMTNDKTVRKL